jgi:hypothetical protein
MIGSVYPVHPRSIIKPNDDTSEQIVNSESLIKTFEKYTTNSVENSKIKPKTIDLPWLYENSQILEWWINIKYNGQTFQKQIPLDIFDFSEKFLKHPEYGEILRFNIDEDPEEDVQIIAGFYWSVVIKPDGSEVRSLEKRLRMIQLQTGNYIDDDDASFEVWSELHVNYGLFKTKAKTNEPRGSLYNFIKNIFENKINKQNTPLVSQIIQNVLEKLFPDKIRPLFDDNDYISIGSGYRSNEGHKIPRYIEKRFSFAREELFSPSIFQHQFDPGTSQGKDALELLYGYQSYRSGSSQPTYDIEFSVTFQPTVYLKTKFIPLGGHVYYYFDDASRQSSQTCISFTSNILKGASGDEGFDLTLLLNKIDETLGSTGKWFSFDIDVLNDFDILGGKISYQASDIFNIDIIADSVYFEEKIKMSDIPKEVVLSWDLDFQLIPSFAELFAHSSGFIDLSMSSDFGGINVYYPSTDPMNEDMIFIDVPEGIPRNTRIEADATLNLNLNDLMDAGNYVSGKIKHTCSSNIESIKVFLPETEIPIAKVTEIPAYSEARAKLYWSPLHGNAYAWRGSSGPPDPIEINVEYLGFRVHDILTIRDGYIDTSFAITDNGHFYFDTSDGIFGNDLEASSIESGDSVSLFVEEVSANDFKADWAIDTSGEQLKVNDLRFNGMVDTLKNMQLGLNYQGKTTMVNIDWLLRQTGSFFIQVDQESDFTLDFSQFGLNGTDFDLDGSITISDVIQIDFNWKFQQGLKNDGNVDPGFFTINAFNDQALIEDFNLYFTYQDKYGVDIVFENLQFYLDFEWWKGDRLLPYIWLDYEVSADDFDIDLLWTNINGETQWYNNVEAW